MSSSSSSLCALWLVMMLACGSRSCRGLGTFGFDVHHRYSDPVKGVMAIDDLPEKDSISYYAALAHRDRLIHGRGLSAAGDSPLTFADGNQTFHLNSLGFLYYANVSVGTPSSWYLVALDTGSDLFWLPCDCTSCVHGLSTSSGETLEFNIYSPNTSSTSSKVPCNSTMCPQAQQRRCPAPGSGCPYQVSYVSNDTSSTGVLVEDVLRLTTDDAQSTPVGAQITFGCGKVQTGFFLEGGAPNGLLGLGVEDVSVPSTLASKGLASNSFSLCFGTDGTGRISFGDKGSSDQRETPFNIQQTHPTISVTQVNVGGNAADLEFDAVFDSGTSFTYWNDPAYTHISESFNSMAKGNRHSSPDPSLPFEYCYYLSATNQTNFLPPKISLTMKGGAVFDVTDPIVEFLAQDGSTVYCLGVVKSKDINIIGQNFMMGYKIVFDREKPVLGWKASNCYDKLDSISPTNSPAIPPTNPHAIPPAAPPTSGATQPPTGHSARLISLISALLTILIMIFAIV